MGIIDQPESLRLLRLVRGLSQDRLARLARIHPSYLCRIERGTYKPSAAVLQRLSDALGLPDADTDTDPPEDRQP